MRLAAGARKKQTRSRTWRDVDDDS